MKTYIISFIFLVICTTAYCDNSSDWDGPSEPCWSIGTDYMIFVPASKSGGLKYSPALSADIFNFNYLEDDAFYNINFLGLGFTTESKPRLVYYDVFSFEFGAPIYKSDMVKLAPFLGVGFAGYYDKDTDNEWGFSENYSDYICPVNAGVAFKIGKRLLLNSKYTLYIGRQKAPDGCFSVGVDLVTDIPISTIMNVISTMGGN